MRISAVMRGRRPFWPPNWDAAWTPIVSACDRRVPFIAGFAIACSVAAKGEVSEPLVSCARGASRFLTLLFRVFHIILGLRKGLCLGLIGDARYM